MSDFQTQGPALKRLNLDIDPDSPVSNMIMFKEMFQEILDPILERLTIEASVEDTSQRLVGLENLVLQVTI